MKFIDEQFYKNLSGIYIIINTVNKHAYVGQTKMKYIKRYWHHVWKLNHNTHDNKYLQRAWNKYGKDCFVFKAYQVIDTKEPQEVFDELEEKIIAKYKNRNQSYNILDNGTRKNLHCSENAKKLIGEKNRINMLGRKHSDQTKSKMSVAHKNANHTRYKKTSNVTDEIVYNIKTCLMSGMKSMDIVKQLNVSYGVVNGILSNDSWSNVLVEGWDEFQKTRKRNAKASYEEIELFQDLFYNKHWTIHKISNQYHRSYDLVKRVVNLAHDNPMPSLNNEEG